MNKYNYKTDFRRNALHKKILRNKQISLKINKNATFHSNLTNLLSKKSDVAFLLKKKIRLSGIRQLKAKYYNSLQKKQPKEGFIKKRMIKLIAFAVLFVCVVVTAFLAQSKSVTIVINGVEKKVKTNQFFSSIYVKKLAKENKFKKYQADVSTKDVIKNSAVIKIDSLKTITTNLKDQKTTHKTYANNLSEFLAEQKSTLDKYNGKYTYYIKEYPDNHDKVALTNISDLNLFLMSKYVKEKTIVKKYKTKYVDSSKVASGVHNIKQKGQNAKFVQKYEAVYLNDKKVKSSLTVSKVLQKGQPKIIVRGTNVNITTNSVWDRLAKCETGGRWNLNSGNGFYGGLQFSAGTWRTAASKVGVSEPYAHLASKANQIKAATWLQKNSGWGQWPHCSSKLGLRSSSSGKLNSAPTSKDNTTYDGVWDRLAQCETGGRWNLNSGNGFYGGLQFSAETWKTASARVNVSVPLAHLASKGDQIKAATWLQKNSGWGQWPHCSNKLGLR